MKFLCLLLLVSYCYIDVTAFPNGAPSTACASMEPFHVGATHSKDPSPYQINVEKTEIDSATSILVHLKSIQAADTFKGYLIMAFDENEQVTGFFSGGSNLLDCSNQPKSAATHSDAKVKSEVALIWKPTPAFSGTVHFKATFVKDYTIYWSDVVSETVKITPVAPPTTTQHPITNPPTRSPIVDIYEGCGTTKGCFGSSIQCIEEKNCDLVASYQPIGDKSHVRFELYADKSTNGNYYAALAFAQQPKMGSDLVIDCANYNDRISAHKAENSPGRINQRLPDDGSLKLIIGIYSEGRLYCQIDAQRQLNAKNTKNIDLIADKMYLLLAKGEAEESKIEFHDTFFASARKVNLNEKFLVGSFSALGVLKKVHGSLMVAAWLLASCIGMLFPMYMKNTWVNKQWLGKARWFLLHQVLMSLTVLLTCAGFIIIFIDLEGWVPLSIAQEPHALIGTITTGLALIQPFMAFLRPLPSSPSRKYFNWLHRCVGYSAHALAVACIFLAVDMQSTQLPTETYWILGSHCTIYALTHLVLSVMVCSNKKFPFQSQDGADERGSIYRRCIVAAFAVCAVALTITVIVIISTI